MGPIDYTANVANPLGTMLAGMQGGLQVRGLQQEQVQRQQIADAQAAKLAAEQQKAQLESEEMRRQQAYMQTLEATQKEGYQPERLLNLAMFLPKDTAKAIQESVSLMTAEQQRNSLGEMTGFMSAMTSGNLPIARELLTNKAAAYRNSGKEEQAKQMDAFLAGLEDDDPADVIIGIGTLMSQFPEGKQALESIGKIQAQPFEQKKLETEANYGESKALQEHEMNGWNIEKLKQDFRFRPIELSLRQQEAETARMNAGLTGRKISLDLQKTERDIQRDLREYKAEAENNFDLAQETEDIFSRLTDPANAGDLKLALGATGAAMPSFTKAGAIKQDIERLSGLLTKDNMRAISGPGVMTDGDRKFALSVVSGLTAGGNQERQIEQIGRLAEKFRGISGRVANKYGMPSPSSEEAASMPTGFRVIGRK